jgi:hypothetical protein
MAGGGLREGNFMRCEIVAFAVALAACGQSTPPPPPSTAPADDAAAGASGVGNAPQADFTLDPATLGGQWSFDRSCGLYDLVFSNGEVSYYDYSDASAAISYAGTWTIDGHRVALALHRLDPQGAPTGPALDYALDVKDAIANDLIADFGREGQTFEPVNARRCELEDRE